MEDNPDKRWYMTGRGATIAVTLLALLAATTIFLSVLLAFWIGPSQRRLTTRLNETRDTVSLVCTTLKSNLEGDERLRGQQVAFFEKVKVPRSEPIVITTKQRELANQQDLITIRKVC